MAKYNPEIHNRRSIRLKGYDYSKEGLYFITICTQNREHLFGEIIDGNDDNVGSHCMCPKEDCMCPKKDYMHQNNPKMKLNSYGKIVEKEIIKTNEMRKNIKIEEYVIMPNHIHFIIEIIDNEKTGHMQSGKTGHMQLVKTGHMQSGKTGHMQCAPITTTIEKFGKSTSNTIPTIVKLLKSSITKQINILRDTEGCPVWQRNYYENIIRNEKHYKNVSEYIKNNPLKWNDDKYHNL